MLSFKDKFHDFAGRVVGTAAHTSLGRQLRESHPDLDFWYKRNNLFKFPDNAVLVNKDDGTDLKIVCERGHVQRVILGNIKDPSFDDEYVFGDVPDNFLENKKQINETLPHVQVVFCMKKHDVESQYKMITVIPD